MELNDGFNFLKARMARVVSMLERMAVKVTFASDVSKLDCDGWFSMLLLFLLSETLSGFRCRISPVRLLSMLLSTRQPMRCEA